MRVLPPDQLDCRVRALAAIPSSLDSAISHARVRYTHLYPDISARRSCFLALQRKGRFRKRRSLGSVARERGRINQPMTSMFLPPNLANRSLVSVRYGPQGVEHLFGAGKPLGLFSRTSVLRLKRFDQIDLQRDARPDHRNACFIVDHRNILSIRSDLHTRSGGNARRSDFLWAGQTFGFSEGRTRRS